MGWRETENEKRVRAGKPCPRYSDGQTRVMEDPRLFPYEIEVEAGSDEVTLMGKVSTEAEKVAAAEMRARYRM